MEIVIQDYEQKKIDKKRTSITLRLSALQAAVLSQVFWKSEKRGSSFSGLIRTALCEFFKNHHNINIPLDFRDVDEQ